MDKKDVLKAIMNVKKYAKNLKKNATTMSQINVDDEIQITSPPLYAHSTIQLYGHRQQTNQSIPYQNISSFRDERDINQFFLDSNVSKISRNLRSTIQPSNHYDRMSNFSEKQKKTILAFNRRTPGKNPSNISNLKDNDMLSHSINHTYGNSSLNQISYNNHQNYSNNFKFQAKFIKQLELQIQFLQKQLQLYKKAMLLIKQKYINMQSKVYQKMSVDHFVDMLKQQLQIQRENSFRLNQTIEIQRKKIQQYNIKIANLSEKLSQIHLIQINEANKLWKQNQILRNILILSQPTQNDLKIYSQLLYSNKQNQLDNEDQILEQKKYQLKIATNQNMLKQQIKQIQKDVQTKIYQFNF